MIQACLMQRPDNAGPAWGFRSLMGFMARVSLSADMSVAPITQNSELFPLDFNDLETVKPSKLSFLSRFFLDFLYGSMSQIS